MSRTVKICRALFVVYIMLCSSLALAEEVFTHSVIKLPFEVHETSPWSQMIETQAEWDRFYRDGLTAYIGAEAAEQTIPPQFDFERYAVVAGGLGSAYPVSDILVHKVNLSGGSPSLSMVILSPGDSCSVVTAVYYPTIALLIPRPAASLQFYVREVFNECPLQ